MKLEEIVNCVSEDSAINKKQAKLAVASTFGSVGVLLSKEGDKLVIPSFGTFLVKKRNARVGRNPQTGEAIQIAEKLSLTFKASKLLQENY